MARRKQPQQYVEDFMQGVMARNPGQPEYHQAVAEVVQDVMPLVLEHRAYQDAEILRRLAEPDRVIAFRVCWQDDDGHVRVERGWRVQHSNAIGPYKGGLRFHADLGEGVLRFLGFEQTLKNSLTGLPLGGGKGGATFNPRGKSDDEVMRFCQSYMTELYRHIGPNADVPAGDMGVGAREIGFLSGQYKRIVNRFEGALTGKGSEYGGSLLRPEATGFGAALFLAAMLKRLGEEVEGKRVLLSGSGNVALYAAEKLVALGATVLTLSDSDGFVHDPDGFDAGKVEWLKAHKLQRRGRIADYVRAYPKARFHARGKPWRLKADVAMPCATENELDEADAQRLADNGVLAVVEGANMPCTAQASRLLRERRVLHAPGKAANAGGVAVSGLEMAQNAALTAWSAEQMNERLGGIMTLIHERCVEDGMSADKTHVDYPRGANIAGFRKVADAMLAYGVV